MYSSRFVAMWPPSTATGERSTPYYSPASDRDARSELDHALGQQLEVLRGRRAVALHPAEELAPPGEEPRARGARDGGPAEEERGVHGLEAQAMPLEKLESARYDRLLHETVRQHWSSGAPLTQIEFVFTPRSGERRRKLREAPLGQRNEVVFADSLQHQERRRGVATVDHQVRAFRAHRKCLAGSEADFLLGIAEEDADLSLQDVERVLDVVVVMPGHFLLRRDLNLVDPEAGALGVRGPPLDLVEMARVLNRFHEDPLESKSPGTQYIAAETKGSCRLRYGFRGMASASPVSRRDFKLLRISGQPSFTASSVAPPLGNWSCVTVSLHTSPIGSIS